MPRKRPIPPPEPEVPAPAEGQGGGAEPAATSRSELKLVELALKGRWGAGEKARRDALKRVGEILANPAAGHRAHMAAARVLLAADAHDLQVVEVAIKAELHEEVKERLEKLERSIQ